MSILFSKSNSSLFRRPRRKTTQVKRRLAAEPLEARQMLAGDLITDANVMVGDLNYDDIVDSADMGLMLNNFGATENTTWEGGDLNADSIVDSTDLGMLLNNFNKDMETVQRLDATAIDLIRSNGALFGNVFGEFKVSDDVDVFKFTSEVDQPFTASISYFASDRRIWHIELLDANGDVLAETIDTFREAGIDAELTAGSYFLRVSSPNNALGDYLASVTLGTPPAITAPDGTTTELHEFAGALFGQVDGVIGLRDEVDVFRFTTYEDQPFWATIYLPLNKSASVELVDVYGRVVPTEMSEGAGHLSLSGDLASGTYSLRVVSNGEVNPLELNPRFDPHGYEPSDLYSIDLQLGEAQGDC